MAIVAGTYLVFLVNAIIGFAATVWFCIHAYRECERLEYTDVMTLAWVIGIFVFPFLFIVFMIIKPIKTKNGVVPRKNIQKQAIKVAGYTLACFVAMLVLDIAIIGISALFV